MSIMEPTELPLLLLSIRVNVEPKGQPRVKGRYTGKFIQIYTPDVAKEFKAALRREALRNWNGVKFEGPLLLRATCMMPRPGNHFRSVKKVKVLKIGAPTWHTAKPDVDNLAKAVMDSMSDHLVRGITDAGLWHDDCQVAWLDIRKNYTPDGSQLFALVSIYRLHNHPTQAVSA